MQVKYNSIIACGSLITPFSYASESGGTQQPMSVEAVASMLLSLLTVIAIIFVLAWLFKRFNVVATGNGVIKVLASIPVGRSERLLLVQVGSDQLLLGITAQGISMLHRLDSPLELDTLYSEIERGNFADKFNQFIKRTRNDK